MSSAITTAEVEESKETYWQRVLQQWQASGLKGREFQRRNKLGQHETDGYKGYEKVGSSVIESAKANGQEPYWYLWFLLNRLMSAKTTEDPEKLLPQKLRPDDVLRGT